MAETERQYNPKELEAKWGKRWLEERVYEPDLDGAGKTDATKPPFYNLWMFPYPSAEGLHIGGARTFVGVDIYGRYKRMAGFDVFQPVGLDGFGIHSENYALKIGKHPIQHAADSQKNFYRQMEMLGNGYAWDEKIETYDPEYYRWTQWIFVQLWKHGLAYRKKQLVNWCPKDLTVLADEQVEGGRCERCGSIVEKKDLEQWFFRITKYADRLLANIDGLDWSENVKIAQRNWIGKSEGAEIKFLLNFKKNPADNDRRGPDGERAALTIFTTRPDTLFGATYLVLSPEHLWVMLAADDAHDVLLNKDEVKAYVEAARAKSEEERIAEGGDKTGVELKGVVAINPATNAEIPIYVADYVLGSYGTGAIMAVPAEDERDAEFAKKYGLPVKEILTAGGVVSGPKNMISSEHPAEEPIVIRERVLMDSGEFTGMNPGSAQWKIVERVNGIKRVNFRLRDWLISRQRYWGPPIPMIYCPSCAASGKGEHVAAANTGNAADFSDMPGWYAVPEADLPVRLPNVENFRPTGTGMSPLAAVKEFYEVQCPGCGGPARRETDVSDTFLDSSWYFLRYPSARDDKAAWDPARTKRWLPVNSYIGGAEHAVLHLLYSRFVTMVFHDAKLLDFEEPFTKFRAHGLITKDGAKMSKSKGNVVNPDEYFGEFGADAMRMHLAFMAPLEQGGDFQEGGILGTERFLKRAWKFIITTWPMAAQSGDEKNVKNGDTTAMQAAVHKTIKQVGDSIDKLKLNTGVSALMILLNAFEDVAAKDANSAIAISRADIEVFLKMLAPYAPYMAEELWRETAGHATSIHREPWPVFDPAIVHDEKIRMVFQVNGKTRDAIEVDATITEEEAKTMALANPKVQKAMGGSEGAATPSAAQPKKIIYVDKKLVNIVI
jgi:leucyl-tRNA synthetase